MPASDPAATRQRLLDAAWRVLTRHGTQALSLNAVAREATVSKGGLLHHFPTRASLLDALYDRWNDEFESEVTARAMLDDGPGGWARAYLDAAAVGSVQPGGSTAEVGFLAALFADPEQLQRFRQRYERWQNRLVQDRIDPATATLVRLAADGMWLAEILGLAPPTGELRHQMLETLRALTAPAGPSPAATGPAALGSSTAAEQPAR